MKAEQPGYVPARIDAAVRPADITELRRVEGELRRARDQAEEALEQQLATADILRAISRSPSDSQPVFDAIVRTGLRLFAGAAVSIALVDGQEVHAAAIAESDPARAAAWRDRFPFPLSREYMHGVAILDGIEVDVPDVRQAPEAWAAGARNFLASGYLAITIVPLLRGHRAIGAFSVVRREPGPLSPKQHAALRTFAEQAVIAIENARLFNEIRESLEQQTASAEILRVISGSIGDTTPIFEKIMESCERLFAGRIVGLNLVDSDDLIRMGVYHGPGREGLERIFPLPLEPTSGSSLAILQRRVVHYPDVEHGEDVPEATRNGCKAIGVKSVIFAPLVWEGRGIGAIFVGRDRVSEFSDKEISLLRTFADQAAIGIENARLFKELELRNRDVSEALEQQTATSEILRVISSSPTDVQPVFDAIANSARALCTARTANVVTFDGTLLHLVARAIVRPEGPDTAHEVFPRPVGNDTAAGRAILTQRIAMIPDVLEDAEYAARHVAQALHSRSFLGVPLVRDGSPIGAIVVGRPQIGPFPDKQIALLQTFAEQAVIAIENVRLFNETKEALDQQRASAEVLTAISNSIADTKPVFDVILQSCQRLFASETVGMTLVRGDGMLEIGAYAGPGEAELRSVFPRPLDRSTSSGRAIIEQCVQVYGDVDAGDMPAASLDGARAIGLGAMAFAPMIFGGRGIGTLWIGRSGKGPFSEKQIALLATFADQAVIAIQNARLFNATQEALQTQTATADILKVISESPTDVQPVFDAIAERAKVLCNAIVTGVFTFDGEWVDLVAYHGIASPADIEMRNSFPMRPSGQSIAARAIRERAPVQIADVLLDPSYGIKEAARQAGYRSNLGVPMLKEGQVVGSIVVCRGEPGTFPAQQVKLLQTFADQAVIAIENVRLFNELREKSEQLELASRHKSEFLANMSHELRTPLNAIIGFTRIVMRRSKEALESKQYENLEKILASGQHLLALINSILDLAKVEAGRVELHPEEIALEPLLTDCARTVEPLLDESAVKLVRSIDSTIPPLFVDQEKLRQIVINLLSNAVKFTPKGSIRIEAARGGDAVTIAVHDTGIGIPADKLETVFEEFEQAGRTGPDLQRGTGLGLTIARRFARLMGGDITATSTLGAGSTFTVNLPLRYAPFAPPA